MTLAHAHNRDTVPLTLFLPSEIKTFSSKDFSPFTVEFLGTKIDHGELPYKKTYIVLKSALGVMLKTIENLPVCPGTYDPALVDMAERKRETKLIYTLGMQKEQM